MIPTTQWTELRPPARYGAVGCMKIIRKVVYAVGTVFLLLVIAAALGMVGFHYPHVVQDQPLNDPVAVLDVESNRLFLADGRVIEADVDSEQDITNQLAQSDFMIDVEQGQDGFVGIYARQDGWICGTPWAQPILIPAFRDTVYRNRRELIMIGTIVGEESTNGVGLRMQVLEPAP